MKYPTISLKRAVEVFRAMLSLRRDLLADGTFVRAIDIWEELSEDDPKWKTKLVRSGKGEDYARRLGIVAFGDFVTLIIDEFLWQKAKSGCMFTNFLVAHELTHLGLDHHARNAVTKNYQIYSGPNGMCNIPPTAEEYETNLGAVFFQCGMALFDESLSDLELARRSFSDPNYVKKARRMVRLEAFQNELNRPRPQYPRVVL